MGAIKDPLFGLELISFKDEFPNNGFDENEISYFNMGNKRFTDALIGEDEEIITDETRKHFVNLEMHDYCYGLKPYVEEVIDDVSGEVIGKIAGHPGLGPVLMKAANVRSGPENALSNAMDEYLSEEINKYTGMSFPEWMGQTQVFQKKMLESLRRHKRIKLKVDKELQTKIGDIAKGKK